MDFIFNNWGIFLLPPLAIFFLYVYQKGRKHTRKMELAAERLGLRFQKKDSDLPLQALSRLSKGWGWSRRMGNVVKGEVDGCKVILLDYTASWGFTVITQTVAAFRVAGSNLPAFSLEAQPAKRKGIKFDSHPQFSKNYRLTGADEIAIRQLFGSEVLEFFQHARREVAEFYAQLKRLTPYAFVMPALVLVNVGVFAAMIAGGVDLMSPSIEHLLSWGANYAPKTTGGEWWRLLTSNYIHIGIIHIAVNMWVLWDAGRLVERLLGNVGFIIMYVLSGVFGSFTSVLWNPAVVSAGASGAVFGVYGCLMGYFLLSRGSIPNKVLKDIGLSALVFVAYNVFYAIGEEGIDMAAHIGGLATGFLCGVIMRLPLAWGSAGRRWVGNGIVGGIGTALIALAMGTGFGHVADVEGALLQFGEVEERVLAKFNDTAEKAQANELSDTQVSLILDHEILPPWRAAREALETMDDVPIQQKPLVDKLVVYMNLREEAWRLLSEAMKAGDEEMANGFAEKMQEAEQVIKQINAEFEETE